MKLNIVLASTYQAASEYCIENGFAPADVQIILPHGCYDDFFSKNPAGYARDFEVHYAFGAECIPDSTRIQLAHLLNVWVRPRQ